MVDIALSQEEFPMPGSIMILKSLYYLLELVGSPGNSGHLLFYIWIYQASRMDGNCCSSGTLFYKFYITENLRYKMRI